MREMVTRCDICHRTQQGEPNWKRLEDSGGKYFDICTRCQNVIAVAYRFDILDRIIEVVKLDTSAIAFSITGSYNIGTSVPG